MAGQKVAFLGAGDIADLHAAGVHACEGAELVGLFDTDSDKARSKAERYGCASYRTAEELVADDGVDAVFVLTPLESHLHGVLLALDAGKHVLVEKPAGQSVAEIERMRGAAEAAGRLCVPVHNYLYEDSVMRTRRLLDEGELGDLVAIYVLYNIHHPEAVAARYPGVIRQILTHHAYITCYLGGAPRRAMAMASTINDGSVDKENLAMALLELDGGALAHLQASFAADDHTADNWTFSIKVIGAAGATRFSHADWVQNARAAVHSHTYSAYRFSIQNAVEYFLRRCIGAGEPPLSSLGDAITCQGVIEAIESSVLSGAAVQI